MSPTSYQTAPPRGGPCMVLRPNGATKSPRLRGSDRTREARWAFAEFTAHRVVGIAQIAVVPERVRAPAVARQACESLGQFTGDFGRAREVLILLLAQPRQRVPDVDASARRVRSIRATAVV